MRGLGWVSLMRSDGSEEKLRLLQMQITELRSDLAELSWQINGPRAEAAPVTPVGPPTRKDQW